MALSRCTISKSLSQISLNIMTRNHVLTVMLCVLATVILTLWKRSTRHSYANKKVDQVPSDYHDIQPAREFVLEKAKPPLIQPWRPKYHMTMGIMNSTFSEFLPFHDKLLERLALRRRIVAQHGSRVLGSHRVAKPAVEEFYTWLFGTYLPRRYPSLYKIRDGVLEGPEPGVFIPLQPPSETDEALRVIAQNSDQEYFFLRWEGDGYVARAFVDVFTLIHKARNKLNKSLDQIHGPVPGYRKRLRKSMNRYFASLPKGKLVQRHSWNMALSPDLHCPTLNPLTVLPIGWMMVLKRILDFLGIGFPQMKKEEVDPDKVTVRCERQTLHRLIVNDDTMVFTFHIFPRSLREVRDEGQGEAIADAITGIGATIPEFDWYKASVYWGKAVADWLRD